LEKTRAKLASVEENIISLRAKRAEALLAAEDAGAVVAIDKAIEAESADAVIYRDRIKALQEECRKATYQERGKAIAAIKQKLKRREQIASDLQATIEKVGALYSELTERDEVEILWPFPRRGAGFALDMHSVNKETAWALYSICRGQHVPEPNSVGLGVSGVAARGIDGVVRQQSEAIISRLEVASIADDLLEEIA
jgi:hypothetical protein